MILLEWILGEAMYALVWLQQAPDLHTTPVRCSGTPAALERGDLTHAATLTLLWINGTWKHNSLRYKYLNVITHGSWSPQQNIIK